METRDTCQPRRKWSGNQEARKRRNKKMTEQMIEKLIVASCYVTENGEGNAGYCGEPKRNVAKRLNDAGLIVYKETESSRNHFMFAFTNAGRRKYLDESGNIKADYLITKSDR